MSIEKQLKKVFDVIIDEAKNNEEFAKRIEIALGVKEVETVEVKSKRRKRQPAVLNPNVIVAKGEDILIKELEQLEVPQLKDIISQYAMDPTKKVSKWRSKDKLMNYITEVALIRSKRGDVFK